MSSRPPARDLRDQKWWDDVQGRRDSQCGLESGADHGFRCLWANVVGYVDLVYLLHIETVKLIQAMLKNALIVFAPAVALVCGMLGVYLLALFFETETVGFVFLLGFPFVAGIVIMHFRPKGSFRTFGRAIAWLVGIIFLSLLGSMVTGMEGLLCVAMAIAPILTASLLGGVIYLLAMRMEKPKSTIVKVATLPILAFFVAGSFPTHPKIYEITNTIVIDAPPHVVFEMLKSIPDISPTEIPTRASHLLGVPKPTSAVWTDSPSGAVRVSHWGEDVHFIERITEFEKDRKIAWNFEFPEGWVADGIEDPHIEVGGRYFDVLSGGYLLKDVGGKTHLSLTTRTYDNSGLGAYARFWHEFFFEDFHEVILILVQTRAEDRWQG